MEASEDTKATWEAGDADADHIGLDREDDLRLI